MSVGVSEGLFEVDALRLKLSGGWLLPLLEEGRVADLRPLVDMVDIVVALVEVAKDKGCRYEYECFRQKHIALSLIRLV